MINTKELSEFIARAKRNTFATGGEKVASSKTASKDYLYKEGEFIYRDSYFGSRYDIGQEIVWRNDEPIWGMNYMGGMREGYEDLSKATFRFLKECLTLVDASMPFRGPELHQKGEFKYRNEVVGDVERFQGTERIFFRSDEIYERTYHGGLILE